MKSRAVYERHKQKIKDRHQQAMNTDLPQCTSCDKECICSKEAGHPGPHHNDFYEHTWNRTEEEIQASLNDGVDPSGNDWHEHPPDYTHEKLEELKQNLDQDVSETWPDKAGRSFKDSDFAGGIPWRGASDSQSPEPLFKPGDVVRLKSGSPDFVVVKSHNGSVDIAQWSEGFVTTEDVPEEVLDLVRGAGNKPVESPPCPQRTGLEQFGMDS